MIVPGRIDNQYDQLVALIYQGALEAQPWESALPLLREIFDAHAASLVLRPPASGNRGVILNSLRPDRSSPEGGSALADPNDWAVTAYSEQFFSLDPFVNLPPGKVIALEDILSDDELIASDYYQHYLQPIDLFRILGVDTMEPDGMLARLRFSRRRSESKFSAQDRALLEKITPHLRRAMEIYARLSRMTSQRDVYADTVDQLSVATIILDELGRVLDTNTVARKLLKEADGFTLRGEHLQVEGRDINKDLQQALATVIAAQQRGETSVVKVLRLPRSKERSALALLIRPIPASQWGEGQSSPCAAVFLSDPDLREPASQHILGELFQLTPAESNLAILLSRGLSLAQVSQTQSISQHTARAQLKAIFSKTGVSRQAELVRLVLKSVASLG